MKTNYIHFNNISYNENWDGGGGILNDIFYNSPAYLLWRKLSHPDTKVKIKYSRSTQEHSDLN
jgi:hypothetical protein